MVKIINMVNIKIITGSHFYQGSGSGFNGFMDPDSESGSKKCTFYSVFYYFTLKVSGIVPVCCTGTWYRTN
jgi:hypothetical protein